MNTRSNTPWPLLLGIPALAVIMAQTVWAEPLVMPPLPGGGSSGMPPLPVMTSVQADEDEDSPHDWSATGFIEARAGMRLQHDPYQGEGTLSEARMQWELEYLAPRYTARIRADLLVDAEDGNDSVALNQGRGPLDLREAWLQTSITDWLDLKAGRQVLTWGVGDQLFINDLFPKDWNSFFLGRDIEYLKAPSDAIKLAFYAEAFNLDLVWSPEFDSDRFIDGDPISFYNPQLGRHSGSDSPLNISRPSGDELALRLYKNIGGVEYAFYLYDGFWKSPNSFDNKASAAIFPRLRALGASLRSAVAGGIFSAEIGQYLSRDDESGSNPLVANGETRLLLGFERELATNFTGGVQYYVERLDDYQAYQKSLPVGMKPRDHYRQLLTTRLTYMALNQNLEWSLFAFISPTDEDWFLQPGVSYKYTDKLLLTAGLNVFDGNDDRSFFAQFADNSNIYAGIRYSF